MNKAVLPCPICGGEPYYDPRQANYLFAHEAEFSIDCLPCNLTMIALEGETPDSLVNRWNVRFSVVIDEMEDQ